MADMPTLADAVSTLGAGWNAFRGAGLALGAATGLGSNGAPAVQPAPVAAAAPLPTNRVIQPALVAPGAVTGVAPNGAAVGIDPNFNRTFQPMIGAPPGGMAVSPQAPNSAGPMTAQAWARQNLGKITPYQLQLQRTLAAPLATAQEQNNRVLNAHLDMMYQTELEHAKTQADMDKATENDITRRTTFGKPSLFNPDTPMGGMPPVH